MKLKGNHAFVPTIGIHLWSSRNESKMKNCQIELTHYQYQLLSDAILDVQQVFGKEIIELARIREQQFQVLREFLS